MLSQMLRAAQGRASAHSGEVRAALEAADIPSFWRTIHEAQGELRRCRRHIGKGGNRSVHAVHKQSVADRMMAGAVSCIAVAGLRARRKILPGPKN